MKYLIKVVLMGLLIVVMLFSVFAQPIIILME